MPLPLPLSRFQRLHTRDVAEARHTVAEAFCPHRLEVPAGAGDFETRFHAVRAGQVSLCFLDYGGRVEIFPEPQESFYLVLAPLAGRAGLTHDRSDALYDNSGAAVPPVDRAYRIEVGARSPHLVLRIPRTVLEDRLQAMMARPVAEPVRFDLHMDRTSPGVRSWWRVVSLLLDEAENEGVILRNPLALREVERLLLGQLLLGQPNNYSALLRGQGVRVAPRAIRRATQVIEERAAYPFTVEDLAHETALSVRALQQGFRTYLGTTPTAYLRDVRLRRAREDLLTAAPADETVAAIAARWGFLHVSRFAAHYRDRYGELPSVTLHR